MAGASELVIETRGLTRRFGSQTAVDDLGLAVPRGAVYGFLGPNGSGKTTSIRMLLGLIRPSDGEALLLGSPVPSDLRAVLPRVGALVEGPAFWPYLTGEQNLRRLDVADPTAPARTRDARIAAALDRVGLGHAARKKAHAYSLGMKQRLGLANALLMPRELLVLDEPTNGLDPQGTREVRALVRALAAEGTTVFVSSHLLAEVEQLSTHIGVMRAGRLLAQDTLEGFRSGGGADRVRVETPDTDAAVRSFAALRLTGAVVDGAVEAPLSSGAPPAETIVAALVADGVRVRGVATLRASLEQRFVELTGEGFDVVA